MSVRYNGRIEQHTIAPQLNTKYLNTVRSNAVLYIDRFTIIYPCDHRSTVGTWAENRFSILA
ncbi:MAG: hypothetical protein IM542_10220 [Pseudanabaena sp. M165S2SP1A06QC]|nr:hypothetical protein [Pseudanabaena sp. M165S2SP1A06QC]